MYYNYTDRLHAHPHTLRPHGNTLQTQTMHYNYTKNTHYRFKANITNTLKHTLQIH